MVKRMWERLYGMYLACIDHASALTELKFGNAHE